MQVNEDTPEEAAQNWDLPLEAIDDIVRYCESHRDLLALEADEERRRLAEGGFSIEPASAGR